MDGDIMSAKPGVWAADAGTARMIPVIISYINRYLAGCLWTLHPFFENATSRRGTC
jgi:hypothetical protein